MRGSTNLRGRDLGPRAALVMALIAAVMAGALLLRAQSAPGQEITPLSAYSDPDWQEKAKKYHDRLARVQSGLSSKYRPDQLKLFSSSESPTGGLGLWPNPVKFGASARYLCVFARVQVPPPTTGRAFPDTQSGRILTIMDAYGKNTISILARELETMPDPQLAGAAIIFIYSKKPLSDPAFDQSAEMLGLFMPRQSVITFAQLRMTIQTLFSQSEMLPLLQGQEQLNNFKLLVLQP